MGSFCAPSTNTTTQSNTPPPEVMAAYRDLVARAQGVAAQPYTPYTGQTYSPMTWMTYTGIGDLTGAGQAYQPYLQDAGAYTKQGAAPVAGMLPGMSAAYMDPYAKAAYQNGPQFQTFEQGLAQYTNPYTQSVIDATMAQMQHQDAIAQTGALGTAIKSGNAFGGDRMGVAAAELARGQAMNRASTIAGLQNQGFQQAVSQYNQNQAQALAGATLASGAYGRGQGVALGALQGDAARMLQAGGQMANIGQTAQSLGLNAANAKIAGGQLVQQDQQAQLMDAYQRWQQQQAFPYQQTSWLGNIVTGTGSLMGGTGQTQSPGASPLAQTVGLGATVIGGLGMAGLLRRGGRVPGYAPGGVVGFEPIDFTSMPTYVGAIKPLTRGSGPPGAPRPAAADDPVKDGMGALSAASKMMMRPGVGDPMNIVPAGASFSPSALGSAVPVGMTPAVSPLGPIYRNGGLVPRYADGGDVINPDEPYRMPDQQAIDDWRASSDFLLARDDAPELPPQITRGVAPALPQAASAYAPPPPAPGLGVAGPVPVAAPQAAPAGTTDHPALRPVEGPNPWMSLMQAGLATMASRNPNALGAIGEGGLVGLGHYSKQKEAYDKLDQNPGIDRSGPTMRIYYPSLKQWIDTGIPTMTAAQKEQNERLRETAEESIAQRREAASEREQTRRDLAKQRADELSERERIRSEDRKYREETRSEDRRDAMAARAYPGMGLDAEGKQVPGSYQFNPETREYDFKPGKVMNTGKGAAAGPEKRTALQKDIEYYVENKIAPDRETAAAMLKSGVNDGAVWQRLIQAEKKLMATDPDWVGKPGSEVEAEAQRRVIDRKSKLKESGSAPAAKPAADKGAEELPEAARAALKEGLVTTFNNGQKWTLKNGKPERVQ